MIANLVVICPAPSLNLKSPVDPSPDDDPNLVLENLLFDGELVEALKELKSKLEGLWVTLVL